ncbi:MAG: rod shape-determining protein MreC [Chloroflexia bacterium]
MKKERTLSWTRTLYLFVVLVLVSLSLILLSQGRQLQPVESAAGQVLTPVQAAAHDVTAGIGGWIEGIRRTGELQDENKRLRTALDRDTAEKATIEQLKRENENLRSMLKFQTARPDIKAVQANVIGGDPTGTSEILTVDKGTNDGITTGMAVVSPGGILVGQTKEVKATRSTILLITDISSSIAVATEETLIPGVMEGRWQKQGRLLMRHIPRDEKVQSGDILLTTGIGGVFPKGLIAGQIYNIRQSDVATEKEAEAYPLTQLNAVEQVLIITSGVAK